MKLPKIGFRHIASGMIGLVLAFILVPVFTGTDACAYHPPLNRELGSMARMFFVLEGEGHPTPRWWLLLTCSGASALIYQRWADRKRNG